MAPKGTSPVKTKSPKAQMKNKKVKQVVQQESDEEMSSDESEEETMPVVKKGNKKVKEAANGKQKGKKGKVVAPPPVEEESDSEESDEEVEEVPVVKAKKGKKAAPAPAAKKGKKNAPAPVEEDDDDDEDMEGDSDDDEEEEEEETDVKGSNGVAKAAAEAESDDDDDDEEDDDDESDDDDDDDEEEVVQADNKRKKVQKEAPAKKAKVEEIISMFVGSLPTTMEKDGLQEIFESRGIPILDARKITTKRFGHVDLKNASDEAKATALNGEEIDGFVIKVDRSAARKTEPREQTKGRESQQSSSLFVKNLDDSVTEDTLKDFFDGATEVRLPTDRDGNKKGIAFIDFVSAEKAGQALKDKQGSDLEGRQLFLDFTAARSQPSETSTLFIKNVSADSSEDDIKDLFNGATSVRRPVFGDSGNPKPFAFVEYGSVTEAKKAMETHQGADLGGEEIQITFSKPRESGGRGGRGGFGDRGRGGRGGGFRGRGGFGGDRGRGGRGGGFRGGRGGDRGRGGRGGGGGGFRGGFRGGRD